MNVEAIARLVSAQMREVSRTWCRLIRMDVTYGAPRVESLPVGGLQDAGLPWPMSVTRLACGGARPASFLAFLRVPDAVIIASLFRGMLPKGEHESPELDPEMTDALHRAFDAFGAATGRALREEEGPAIRVRREFSRVAVAPEILAGLALPADGALARIPLAVGGWRMDLWEIVSPPPAPAAAASAPAEGGTTVRRRKAGKGRVLVADDTSSIRTIVKWVLEREGYEVHEAQTGKEAVEKAAVVKPDVVLIDVMMPQMDGFEACRHIRQLPGGGDLAVIITSSKHRPEDVLEGARSGAIDYLVKPFTHATLLDKIRKAREKPRSA